MFVLFETAAGFGIFKVLDEKKLQQTENLETLFETGQKASKVIQLQEFRKFVDSAEALQAGVAINEGKLCKPLNKLLKKTFGSDVKDKLMVSDSKLGNSIKDKFDINVTTGGNLSKLMRCIRFQILPLIPGLEPKELAAMELGLGHNVSRYKLKFSPDKVDTMIIQAIGVLDDLDKELNNYIMRVREWYGWHFPELSKIIPDHIEYVKTVFTIGSRENVANTDLSHILHEDVAVKVQEAAEVTMGTEITGEDVIRIQFMCEEVNALSEYRSELNEYLMSRMMTMSPNLTIIVGELVGARLISHAGSLTNLAKLPASTIQLLGAEKALFSALKTRKSTPKYGTIYHASLVSSAGMKLKGKMARMLAAKAALASRCDALAEHSLADFSIENKARLTKRLELMEAGYDWRISGKGRSQNNNFRRQSGSNNYNNSTENNFGSKRKGSFPGAENSRPAKKFKPDDSFKEESKDASELGNGLKTPKKIKKEKKLTEELPTENETSGKENSIKKEVIGEEEISVESSHKKKKKRKVSEVKDESLVDAESSGKKMKKIKLDDEQEDIFGVEASEKKKKKKAQGEEENIFDAEASGKKKKKKKIRR